MLNANIVICILAIHWIADFIFQSDKMAVNKSTSNYWLTIHVIVYTLILYIAGYWLFKDMFTAISWVIINGIFHWITDFTTSRINSKLWKNDQRHWFFTMIGLDQLIHYTFLFYTYEAVAK